MVTHLSGMFLCVKFEKRCFLETSYIHLSENQDIQAFKKTHFTAIYWKIKSYK